jgi:hypothetical protein
MEVDVLTQHPKLIPCSEQKQVFQGAQRRNKNPDFVRMVASLADCFVGRMYSEGGLAADPVSELCFSTAVGPLG